MCLGTKQFLILNRNNKNMSDNFFLFLSLVSCLRICSESTFSRMSLKCFQEFFLQYYEKILKL